MRLRTSISAYFWALCSLLVTEPSQPRKNASGMEIRPGLSSGNRWKSIAVLVIIDWLGPPSTSGGLPDTTGLKMISRMALERPP